MPREIRSGVRRIFRLAVRRARSAPAEMDEEISFHLDARAARLAARGMAPDDAYAEALRRFGELEPASRELRASATHRERRLQMREYLDEFAFDLRYAVRGLRLRPGFALTIVLILALGIGANTAMFQVIDRLFFRPPAFLSAPARTHQVYLAQTFDGREFDQSNFQYRRYLDLIRATTSFERAAAVWYPRVAIGAGADAREMRIAAISASTFALFDARPTLGRFFTPAEDTTPSGAAVAVLGYAFWQSHFGGDRAVIGKPLQIGSGIFTIIGVAPEGFVATATSAPVAFIPITTYANTMLGRTPNTDYYQKYNMRWMQMFVLRKADVGIQAATTDLTNAYQLSYESQRAIQPQSTPIELAKPHALVGPLLAQRGPNQTSTAKVATWLIGVAAVVLLIACANVANLLLARALRRRREIAVRLALGVSRGRLLRSLLTESLLLSGISGVAGLLLAQWGGALLHAQFLSQSDPVPVLTDGRVLLFAIVTAVATGLLTGLAPGLHTMRGNLAGALKSGVREGSQHRSPLRVGLLVAQGALSMVLLVGAGLFIRSLTKLGDLRLGYDVDSVAWVEPTMRGVSLDSTAGRALREQLLASAQALPGVVSATRASTVPFYMEWDNTIFVPGLDTAAINRMGSFAIQTATPDYFTTMGTRLLRGRGITEADRAGAPRVMVVSEAMAEALWPGHDPLGQCVRVGADTAPCTEVVGVAETTRTQDVRDDKGLMYYLPSAQGDPAGGGLFVRVRGDAAGAEETIRRALQEVMPGLSYVTVSPMSNFIGPEMRSWQLGAVMFTLFGALALVLAAFGLYSVIAYNVTQRSHELGVRVALGASAGRVLRLILSEGVRIAVAGVAIGTVIALIAAPRIAPLLFHESPRDPAVFVTVSIVLIGAAVLASLVPAHRASRIDPAAALRSD